MTRKSTGPFVTISSLADRRELAALLGDLTVAWSHAERICFFAFWVASGMTQTKAFDVYESLSGPKARMSITLDLLNQDKADHPDIPQLKEMMSTIVSCGKLRNDLVHGTWMKDARGEIYITDRRMPNKVLEGREVDEEAIAKLIKQINGACDAYLQTLMRIYPGAFAHKA